MCTNHCGYGFGIARLRSNGKEVSVMFQHHQLIQIWVTQRPQQAPKSCPIPFFQERLFCKLNYPFKGTTADCRLLAIACEAEGQCGPAWARCWGSKKRMGRTGWRAAWHSVWDRQPLLATAAPIYVCLPPRAMKESRRGRDFTRQVWGWEWICFWDSIL